MKLYAWSGAIVPAAQVPVVVVFKVLISTKETVSDLWELVGVDRADLLSCIESWKFKQRAQDELNELSADYLEVKAKLEEETRRQILIEKLGDEGLIETVNPTKVIRIKKED